MKTIILCGGMGTRLGNEANYIPKAMVKVGPRPIVWHVMKRYSLAGYTDFTLALGKGGEMIRDYFTHYGYYTNDVKISLGKGLIENLSNHQEKDWTISLIDTGILAMSGARIERCKQFVEDDEFMVTYADCVADVDFKKLIAFHKKSKKIATVTGVIPPYRETEFLVKNDLVTGFYNIKNKKNISTERLINGGYMIFRKEIFSYLNSFNECKLESEIFLQLIKDNQLAVYPHYGFWRWLDTERDYIYLNDLADKNEMYWLRN